MKIRFIYPKFEKLTESWSELGELSQSKSLGNFRMPPALGIPILTSLTPENITCTVFDENVEPIDFDDDADLFAISFFTPQAENAYKIADRLKQKGKKVIAGGMHPSMMPDEASMHFNSVCIGEAENVWFDILNDFKTGNLKKFYTGGSPSLSNMPLPKRNIFKDKDGYDWSATLVQVMRGCSYNCENCILPVEGGKEFRFRPIDKVIEDIESLKFREFFLTDDTLVLPNKECKTYFLDLLKETQKLDPKPRMFLSGSLNMPIDDDYLKQLVDGGIVSIYLVLGCDPFSINAMRKGGDRFFNWSIDIVKKLQDAGLHVFSSHGFGFDYQDVSSFDKTLEFIEKTKIDTSEFYILTPFPQTPSWHKFNKENRLLHTNWTKYNTANVVFKPKNMTEDQLTEGFLYVWKEFYKNYSINDSLNIFTPN
ncbi:MAG: hypothetical protein C0594_12415, partial [Marinilabiliales bacterium]